jgi:2-phospho-L-lactate transferase/gluconeogenesis factor (CofD/UPF0052 family)
VELNALINAYDDGLSTGELRGFIPGMLGPSDFRKNLSNFLHLHSSYQYAMTRLLEFRLSEKYQEREISYLKTWSTLGGEGDDSVLPEDLRSVVRELDRMGPRVRSYLAAFFEYQAQQGQAFKFVDCSLGNLVFAGAYLKNNRNFNATAAELAREFHSKARLLNVTQGENRILVALKEDGEILERESRIVSAQSAAKILDLFFLEKPLSPDQLERIRMLPDTEAKRAALKSLEKPVTLSSEARDALLHSDIIVYGPGTQFSSLFPSYKTPGLNEAIAASNLLGDPVNERRLLTHVLYTSHSSQPDQLIPRGAPVPEKLFKNLKWVEGEFENPARSGVHSGYMTVRRVFNAYEEALTPVEPELDIYINLYERSLAINQLIQEFLELPWHTQFKRVRLRFNNVDLPRLNLPPHLLIESIASDEMFSEVHELSDWASSRRSKYLVTISGDGEYRLCDILYGLEILVQHPFAAVYGSRTQSRNQFYHSLDAAYGESPFLYTLSLIGGFLFSLMFVLRFGVIFSDPLTGFRLYNRSSLSSVLGKLSKLDDHSASGITKILMQNGCEIAEIPVLYRTFHGFTKVRWRLLRSFRNAWRIFF